MPDLHTQPRPLQNTERKNTLSGVSFKLWCEQRGSNPRPQPWQGCALAN